MSEPYVSILPGLFLSIKLYRDFKTWQFLIIQFWEKYFSVFLISEKYSSMSSLKWRNIKIWNIRIPLQLLPWTDSNSQTCGSRIPIPMPPPNFARTVFGTWLFHEYCQTKRLSQHLIGRFLFSKVVDNPLVDYSSPVEEYKYNKYLGVIVEMESFLQICIS